MRLSIVIPAYNEKHRIGAMMDAYLPYFSEKYGDSMEFIVVVNGSTDGTEDVVTAYQSRYPQVVIVVEPKAVGKGGALRLGFHLAKGALVGFVDADGATPPEAFQALVENIEDNGCIIASRWMAGSLVSPRQPLSRRIASRCFNIMVRTLFRLNFKDTQCGAKVLSCEALEAVLPRLGTTKWIFDVDLLFHIRACGFKIREIPTVWHDVADSRVKISSTSRDMAWELICLRIKYSPFSRLCRTA